MEPQAPNTLLPQKSQVEKTLSYIQQKRGNNRVYVQGLVAVAVFVLSLIVAIFIYIPYISSTNEVSEQVKAVQADVAALEKKYKVISGYDKDELDSQLTLVGYYIPDDIRVAQLATFINSNAVKYSLTVSRLGINEDRAEVKQSANTKELAKLLGSAKIEKKIFLGRVEGPFSFRGSRDNIFKFLDFLVLGGYATNFDQVNVSAGASEKEWGVNFYAVYYYLEPLTQVEAGRQLVMIQKDLLSNLQPPKPTAAPTPEVTGTGTPTPTVTK